MIMIYVLITLPQRARDSLEQEYACTFGVYGNMPFCLSFRTSDHLRGRKRKTGLVHVSQRRNTYSPLEYHEASESQLASSNEAISNVTGEELAD
jgi:hypothetical protein